MKRDEPYVGAIGARNADAPEADPSRTVASILNMIRIQPRPKEAKHEGE